MRAPGPVQFAVSHPTGNRNVRAALSALQARGMLHSFWTGMAWHGGAGRSAVLPASLLRELERRRFADIPRERIVQNAAREIVRLAAQRLLGGVGGLSELPLLRADGINRAHDGFVARGLRADAGYQAVYAPIGASYRTFATARRLGLATVLEMSSAYYGFYRDLIAEEAERAPAWAPTLRDAIAAVNRPRHDDAEIATAGRLIVPSRFVADSLRGAKGAPRPIVVPYGCPPATGEATARPPGKVKLQVLFVGSLTQAKGLSYLFAAAARVSSIADLTVVGGLRTRDCRALNDALGRVRWIERLTHPDLLRLMAQCDVLVLPSLAEGMALVVGEAMAQGCAVVVTPNAGNDVLVRDGDTGFVVPVRDSDAIERALVTLHGDRDLLATMSRKARAEAAAYSDAAYGAALCQTLAPVLHD